jgi:integration host factor subunit beta
MLRSQLIERLVETHPHLPRSVVEAALNAILNEITDSLAKGSRIEIRGFGRARQARTGRDPRTGEAVPVFAKRVPRFRASNLLLDRLNRPTTPG